MVSSWRNPTRKDWLLPPAYSFTSKWEDEEQTRQQRKVPEHALTMHNHTQRALLSVALANFFLRRYKPKRHLS